MATYDYDPNEGKRGTLPIGYRLDTPEDVLIDTKTIGFQNRSKTFRKGPVNNEIESCRIRFFDPAQTQEVLSWLYNHFVWAYQSLRWGNARPRGEQPRQLTLYAIQEKLRAWLVEDDESAPADERLKHIDRMRAVIAEMMKYHHRFRNCGTTDKETYAGDMFGIVNWASPILTSRKKELETQLPATTPKIPKKRAAPKKKKRTKRKTEPKHVQRSLFELLDDDD